MAFGLLFITCWSFPCNLKITGASFSLSVPQPVHQGETGGAVTLDWLLTSPTHISPDSMTFHCTCIKPTPVKTFCVNDNYIKYPEHQDEQFRGRVSWEREALQNGTLRFQLSNLTTQDSGTYYCIVAVGDEDDDGSTILKVADLGWRAHSLNKERDFQALQRGWYGLLGVLCLLVLGFPAAVTLTCLYLIRRRCHHQEEAARVEYDPARLIDL